MCSSDLFGPLRALGTRVTVPEEEPHWPAGIADDLPAVCAAGGLGLTPFSFEPPISQNTLIYWTRVAAALTQLPMGAWKKLLLEVKQKLKSFKDSLR